MRNHKSGTAIAWARPIILGLGFLILGWLNTQAIGSTCALVSCASIEVEFTADHSGPLGVYLNGEFSRKFIVPAIAAGSNLHLLEDIPAELSMIRLDFPGQPGDVVTISSVTVRTSRNSLLISPRILLRLGPADADKWPLRQALEPTGVPGRYRISSAAGPYIGQGFDPSLDASAGASFLASRFAVFLLALVAGALEIYLLYRLFPAVRASERHPA
jgi:hypothetical protein